MFNKIFALYKLSHDVAEVTANVDGESFAYIKTQPCGKNIVLFSSGIVHDAFPDSKSAIDELERIWLLIREAETNTLSEVRTGSCTQGEKWKA